MKQFLLSLFLLFLLLPAYSQWSEEGFGFKEEITIYPNPAQDFFSLKGDDSVQDIRVFNLLGKLVKTFVSEEDNQFFVGDLPKGTYLVQFIDPENKIIATRRMNKQ
jgi:hypothetical protein